MDKDILQSRLKDLELAQKQIEVSYHQMSGRIEEVKFLLSQLEIQTMIDEGEEG